MYEHGWVIDNMDKHQELNKKKKKKLKTKLSSSSKFIRMASMWPYD